MNTNNVAIVQDDILVAIVAVLEDGHPPGPAFASALSALVEAVVLHERVYFDVAGDVGTNHDADWKTSAQVLEASPFVRALVSGGAMSTFPEWSEVEASLSSRGIDYTEGEFLQDAKWRLDLFVPADFEGERMLYVRHAFLMHNYPGVYTTLDLVDEFAEPGNVLYHHPHVAELAARGMPLENLIELEGYNHAAKAYVDVANHLGADLYLYNCVFPHQHGAIHLANTLVRQQYQQIVTKFVELFGDVGDASYDFVTIPPLTRLLFARCQDAVGALAVELLALRQRYAAFRSYLVAYENEWRTAQTVKDRLRLKNDFKAAWEQLSKDHEGRRKRFIYVLWDLLKEPTKLLTKIGDKLAAEGQRQSVIGRVSGLNTFWTDMLETPLDPGFQRLFRSIAPDPVWQAAQEYGKMASAYANSKSV